MKCGSCVNNLNWTSSDSQDNLDLRGDILRVQSVLFLSVLLLSVTAEAQSVRGQGPSAVFTEMAGVLGQNLHAYNSSVRVTPRGRQDIVIYSHANFDETLNRYLEAYRHNRVLPGGITVAGYFVVPDRRKASVTLLRNGQKYMFEFDESREGIQAVLAGIDFSGARARRGSRARTNRRGALRPRTRRAHHF